jgi:hypothetical protein
MHGVARLPYPPGYTPRYQVNSAVIERIRRHKGKTTTIVAGDGWSLSAGTACTYLHDVSGNVSACLLETAGDDDVVEVADFFCQQVVMAESPTPRLREMGIVGLAEGPLTIVTYMEGLSDGERGAVEKALMSLTKKARHLGRLADWPDGVFL